MKLWIARDPDGGLFIHEEEPFFSDNIKGWLSNNWIPVSCNDYPKVTFENSPMEVELVIKK